MLALQTAVQTYVLFVVTCMSRASGREVLSSLHMPASSSAFREARNQDSRSSKILSTCLQDGLLIVNAKYGVLEEILRQERSHASSSEEASTGAESTRRTEESQRDSRGAAGTPSWLMLHRTF